jgi:hypothetical protein
MAVNTDGIKFIALYQKIYKEATGKELPLNKFALKNHAAALIEEFGMDTCLQVAEYNVKHARSPENVFSFLYQFTEVYDSMLRADKDRLDRLIQRERLYEAMRTELDVSE